MQYPNPCVRCGFCCTAETCPLGQRLYAIGRMDKCPGLVFEGDKATCQAFIDCWRAGLPEEDLTIAFGIGAGCCIKARVFRGGVQTDYASLPAEMKIKVMRQVRRNGGARVQ